MPRRTADEAEKTRHAILAAARHLFATQGFAATATTAVVERAGVTRGALYHHFADKTALFRAVFVAVEHELNDAITAAALAEHDALAAFTAGCRACLEFVSRPDYFQIAVVDAPGVLGGREWHDIDAGIGVATLRGGLDALERQGLLRLPSTPVLAVLLFGAVTEASIVLARGELGSPTQAELLDTLLRLVIADGAAPGAG